MKGNPGQRSAARRSLHTAVLLIAAAATLWAPAAITAQAATPVPIPQDPRASLFPSFIGGPATSRPVAAPSIPQSPFMAPNGRSNVHDDAYMSDTYATSGPLGRNIQVRSTYLAPGSECGSVTFDAAGRILSVCIGITASPAIGTSSNVNLLLLDPRSLARLAVFALPARAPSPSPFNDFSAGGYFYLDAHNRAVIPTTTRHVLVVAEAAGPSLHQVADYDLSVACPQTDKITSALPDASGRLWFASFNGWVGTIDRGTGAARCLNLAPLEAGHLPAGKATAEIENSFAVDPTGGGVYIVSETAMYRFAATSTGAPSVVWQRFYDRTDVQKPGQIDTGSGTTPTLMGSNLVAITDNADPMDIVVYHRSDGSRVCKQPVFGGPAFKLPAGSASTYASDTDNSLIGTGTSMIVENNYGYSGPAATSGGAVTYPGLERVDVGPLGGCHVVWLSMERAPSVVAKLSLGNGLLYTYTKPPDQYSPTPNPPLGADPWYLTAIDYRSGHTVFSRLAGVGLGYNNNYAPVSIGPDGAAYVGVLGGLVAFRDS